MSAILGVVADHQRWFDQPEGRVAEVQVELGRVRRADLWLDASEELAWVRRVTVELDNDAGLVMVTVMGLTFRFLKMPDDAKALLERCVYCGHAVTRRRSEGAYKHLTERDGITIRRCFPRDESSWQVATPRRLAGMIVVDVPTEETSTVPLAEVHAGQYVVMPTRLPV